VKYLSVGKLHREFIIDFQGRSHEDLMGGSCLYGAGAMNYWGDHVGIVGMIGKEFPPTWQAAFTRQKIDSRGILQVDNYPDQREFLAYPAPPVNRLENPVAVYASRGLNFPRGLLGYAMREEVEKPGKSVDFTTQLINHLPPDYLGATAAYLAALDFTSQVQLTTWFFKGSIRTVAVHAHPSYMLPTMFDNINLVVKDTTLFVTTIEDLRQLFQGRSTDDWEMMAGLSELGCAVVIARSNTSNWMVYDSYRATRYIIPNYPARLVDPTGSIDAFCGSFLVHFQQSHDALQSAMMGVVAESINAEGTGPFAIQDTTLGLDQKRYQMLQNLVTRI